MSALWVLLAAAALLHGASVKAAAATGLTGALAPPERPLRILTIMTVDTMSHHLWMSPLTVALAKRGHLVESVDVALPKEVPPTLNVTVIENAFKVADTSMVNRWVQANGLQQMELLYEYNLGECKRDLATQALRRFTSPDFQGEFDLIIVDYMAECMLGFLHRFNYPGFVAVSPFPGSPYVHNLLGNAPPPALVPFNMMPFPTPMALWQRGVTAFLNAYSRYLEWSNQQAVEVILRDEFGADVPSLEQLKKNVSLGIINESPILSAPRPYMPNVIPVPLMHTVVANVSNIPADLRTWLEGGKKGFIFVSFGTIMKSSSMDEAKKRALVTNFGKLADYRILWKFNRQLLDMSTLSPNVRVESWLPQNDILGHPKLALFISHCGGLGVQESLFHGVPILGMPIMLDQFVNADKVIELGIGRTLQYRDITEERLGHELQAVLGEPKYRASARRISTLLRDQPTPPLQTAVWWCEYVGRHRGAPHLRSPMLDVSWPEAMLLDVLALALAAAAALLVAAYLLVRTCVRALRPAAPSSSSCSSSSSSTSAAKRRLKSE